MRRGLKIIVWLMAACLLGAGCAGQAPAPAAPQAALLRYGDRTPSPRNPAETVLQRGQFTGEVHALNDLGRLCRGELSHAGRVISVFIKSAYHLHEVQLREGIPFHADNRNADAAYHVNRFLDLVNTPPHVLRDDVPGCDGRGISAAGVQLFAEGSRSVDDSHVERLVSDPALLDELEAMAVFDTIIGNTDRHDSNWRWVTAPAAGERRLLALDHALAFPVERNVRGNYLMIERYLASTREGQLSTATLAKLRAFRSNRLQVDTVLRLNVNPRAIEHLWERVDRLLENRTVFTLRADRAGSR